MPNSRVILQPATQVSPASLRAEGVVEIGRALDTSVLFVLTKGKLYILHAASLPDRALDDYAVELAVNWIENDASSCEVARNLGVSEPTLRLALAAAGYERPSNERNRPRKGASRTRGNRRGRLARVEAPTLT